jgi:hypothetical protein
MADIALTTANKVEVVGAPVLQLTLQAAEAITAGGIVRIDTNGKFTPGNGTTTTEAAIYGVATKTVAAGEYVTAIRRGRMDGFVFSGAYWAAIYASDTDGRLADAAGTVSVVVGRIIPKTGTTLGTAPDKIFEISVP